MNSSSDEFTSALVSIWKPSPHPGVVRASLHFDIENRSARARLSGPADGVHMRGVGASGSGALFADRFEVGGGGFRGGAAGAAAPHDEPHEAGDEKDCQRAADVLLNPA